MACAPPDLLASFRFLLARDYSVSLPPNESLQPQRLMLSFRCAIFRILPLVLLFSAWRRCRPFDALPSVFISYAVDSLESLHFSIPIYLHVLVPWGA
jgi:hypothetical protein